MTAIRRATRGAGCAPAPHIVITNPDMLHAGILPHHTKWAKLFENLRLIVMDEMHTYRGVFGSHLANLLRRLRRVARHYGAEPRFLLSSATIANPGELAERLTERRVSLVERSGAPPAGAVLPLLQPAGGERRTRHPPLRYRGSAPHRPRLPRGQAADHRLRPLAHADRDPRQVSEAGPRDPARPARPHPRLPRRLPAEETAGDRGRDQAGPRARGGLDERARTGH